MGRALEDSYLRLIGSPPWILPGLGNESPAKGLLQNSKIVEDNLAYFPEDNHMKSLFHFHDHRKRFLA